MRSLVSIFLYGFLLDALLSVAGEWLPISPLHLTVAWAVFAIAFALYILSAFMARVPKRFVLPAFLFLAWTNVCGGFPLAFVIPDHAIPVLDWTQVVLAVALLLWHRHWRRTPPKLDAPAFSWPGFAIIAALSIVGFPLALGVAAVNATGSYIEASSGGYVKVRPEGLVLEERDLEKDGKSVRLVSMMHIGEQQFYENIRESLPVDGSAIVLLEGVTDDHGLLKSRFSYAKVAGLLGLTAQETSEFQKDGKSEAADSREHGHHKSKVEYRSADVDISVFEPLTLEFMNAVATILSDPTAENFLGTVRDPSSPFHRPEADKVVMNDILVKRNEHLIGEIDRALENSSTVIVPWGALHLSAIEADLKNRGFRETGRVTRPVISFWKSSPPAK